MIGAEHALLVGQQRFEEPQRRARIAAFSRPVSDVVAGRERERMIGPEMIFDPRPPKAPAPQVVAWYGCFPLSEGPQCGVGVVQSPKMLRFALKRVALDWVAHTSL